MIKKKTLIIAIAAVLVLGLAVGGAIAYVVSIPDPVKNTFVIGNISAEVTETDTGLDDDEDPTTNSFKMVPGQDIAKDPVFTVKKGSEACYLFVEVVTAGGYSTYLEDPVLASGWTELTKDSGIYYRTCDASDSDKDLEFQILAGKGEGEFKGGYVTVKTTASSIADGDDPSLTFYSGAIQSATLSTASAAWTALAGEDGTLTE